MRRGAALPETENYPVIGTSARPAGISRAQYALGRVYAAGKGMGQNLKAADRWYRRAARHGYVPAQLRLARAYEEGSGVTQNDPRAVSWYRRAAYERSARGALKLASAYWRGRGIPLDRVEAYRWYLIARLNARPHSASAGEAANRMAFARLMLPASKIARAQHVAWVAERKWQ